MGQTTDETHTGIFSIEQCRAAWRALTGVTCLQIRAWAYERISARPLISIGVDHNL